MADAAATTTHAPARPDWRAMGVLLMGAGIIGLSPILVRLTEA